MSWLSSLKSVFSPSHTVNEEAIQHVLQSYVLPESEHALKDRISQVNVQGDILQITINTYPEEKQHLQQIHDELADALEKCGIKELNMHVIQQKSGQKKESCGHQHAEDESCATSTTQTATSHLPPVVTDSKSCATTARCAETSAYSKRNFGIFRQRRGWKIYHYSKFGFSFAKARLKSWRIGCRYLWSKYSDHARQCRQNSYD